MSPVFRRRLLQVHLAVGMAVALVVVITTVCGAWMVFRPQLEKRAYPELFTVSPGAARAPLDLLAANAAAAYPGRAFSQIRFWSEPTSAAMIRCANADQIYLDPWTGRVLGMQNRYRGLFGRAEDIHRFLGLGSDVGTHVTAVAAFALIFLVLSGLVLWVPPVWRGLKAALAINGKLAGRARLLNWHKTVGVVVGGFVVLSALSGLPHAYHWYEVGVYRIVGSEPPSAPTASPVTEGQSRLSVEAIWQTARAALPDYHSANVYFPKAKSNAVEIWIVGADAPHPHARSLYHVDAVTGAMLRAVPWAEASAGHKLFYWGLAWHLGQAWGLTGQVVAFVAALGLPFLAVTGVWAYFRRNRRETAPAN
jgi:uncharacterized iron-regulated membrane protein